MRGPSAFELLDAWERGLGASQVGRGLALLALACPDLPRDALADVSIGERDAHLLSLREAAFGSDLTALVRCPSCGEALELAFATRDLRAAASAAPRAVEQDGYNVALRRLTSRDLAAAQVGDLSDRREALLARCIVSAEKDGAPASAAQLPATVRDAVVQRVAEAEAQADMQLNVACAGCGHIFRAPFDIVSFLWTELEAWAARTLREVHVLASAYGWTEREVLSLGPLRRRQYLGMVNAWQTS